MKIRAVKISNILSFKHKASFDSDPYDIEFEEGINVIVGANGSGKSNFVEILFTAFQRYFIQPYEFNMGYDVDRAQNPQYLKRRENFAETLRLDKHFDSTSEVSLLEIVVELNDSDRTNLEFIKNNLDEIKSLYSKYTRSSIDETDFPIRGKSTSTISRISFKFNITANNGLPNQKVMFVLISDGTDNQKIVDYYLRNFDVFKKVIETANKRDSKAWDSLAISFEFLGAHRTLGGFPSSLDFNNGQENAVGTHEFNQRNQNVKTNSGFGHIFAIPLAKIGNKIARDGYGPTSIPDAIRNQFTDPHSTLYTINTLIQEYLGLNIRYKAIPPDSVKNLQIELFNTTTNKMVDFEQLSSGQKSIFSLIFLVVGLELREGLLVIDEPEIHLHPKLQKKYFNLLKNFSVTFRLQCILITHSPVFIDEKTIRNTYRFYIDNYDTKIVKGSVVSIPEENLIKFLSYTNSAKIFFTNKVILVEGDTDNYFYSYYLNEKGKSDQDFEILTIQGKGEYQKWFDFLIKLKIDCFLLTDFDFLNKFADLGIKEAQEDIIQSGLTPTLTTRVASTISRNSSVITAQLFDAIIAIKDKALPDITQAEKDNIVDVGYWLFKRRIPFNEIVDFINTNAGYLAKLEAKLIQLRTENIYVLRHGNLENYLALPSKGLQQVVDYCSSNSLTSMTSPFKENLEEIFDLILQN